MWLRSRLGPRTRLLLGTRLRTRVRLRAWLISRRLHVIDDLPRDFSLNLFANSLHDFVEVELSKAFATGESGQNCRYENELFHGLTYC